MLFRSLVQSNVMTPLWQLAPGSRYYLANDDGHRGLAYHPSGNLVVVSRTPTNAVHILDGQTGAHLRSLKMDAAIMSGGVLAVNLVACAGDGSIFVGNLTDNGATTPFKLYQWIDDSEDALPALIWQGDPGLGIAGRWGDSMTVRGNGGDIQMLLGSRNGTIAALIRPPFGPESTIVLHTDAGAGSFGSSVAFGSGDSFWGKAVGAPLRLLDFDTALGTATTRLSFPNVANMAALGVDVVNPLLAGVFVEAPDNLRLYDIGGLPSAPVNVDTEFFSTDNANANNAAQVAFGPNVVYALDANNGLVALTLNPALLRPRLNFSRAGNILTLTWSGSVVLQSSATVDGTYADVMGASSPQMIDVSASVKMFYRLRQ